MRFCRTLILTCLFPGLGAAFASSQSLADVAKNEKERRAGTDAQPARTVTDRDLAAISNGPSPAQPRRRGWRRRKRDFSPTTGVMV